MRAGSAPTLLAAAWLAVGAVAAADEPPIVTDARDLRDTQRAESRWQAAGAASVPDALRATCGGESEALAAAGERRLRAVGLPAVVPIVEREVRSAGRTSCPSGELAVEILCQTKVTDDRALEAVVRAVARLDARRPPDSRVATLAGALTFAKRMQQTCANQAVLARAAVAAVAARARAAGPGKERSALAGLLAAAGPAAAPLVPTLASWLGDDAESVGPVAARALANVGPGAVAAVGPLREAIGRWRRHASGAVGPLSADFPREDTLVPLVEALGAIGPGARAAVPELAELLSEESAHFAEGHRGELVIALVRALPRIAPPPASAIGDVRRLLVQRGGAGWHLADSRPSTVGIIGGPDVTWAELVDATGELGPAARPLVPQILLLMSDPLGDARLRSTAAATLGRIGGALPEPAEALRRILVGRGAWLDEFQRRLYDGAGWKDELHMPLLVAEAVNRCRADAGDGPGVGADSFVGLQEGKNGEFAACLAPRLCGPGRDVASAVIATCCDYAYGARRPAICPPEPPLVAAPGGGAVSVERGAQAVPPTTALPISDPERPHIDKPGLEFRGAWGAPQMSHPGGAIAARFRADGTLVSVGRDGSARVWDVAGRRLRAATSAIWSDTRYGTTATISADGRWLAIWRAQGAVFVAPVDGGPVFEIPEARDVRAVAFGPGVVACLGRFGGTRQLRIFDLAGRRVRAGVQADDAEVVALSSDGRSVVLAGSGWARAWAAALDDFPRWSRTDLPADRLDCKNDRGVASCPPSAVFLPDGRLLLGSGAELHLVDAATGCTVTRVVALSITGTNAVEGLTPAADGKSAISITWGHHSWLRFWDLVAGRETAIFHELRAPNVDPRSLGSVDAVAWSPDGGTFVVAADAQIVPVVAGSRLVQPRAGGHEAAVTGVAFTPDGRKVLTASQNDGSVRLWDAATRRELWRWLGQPWRIEMTPGGDAALVAGTGDASMIDLASGAARWRITDLVFGGYARLSPDGASVASFSDKAGFCLHRAADGKRLWCRDRRAYSTGLLAFSPDSGTLAAAGVVDGRSGNFVWDAATGKPLRPLDQRPSAPGLVAGRDADWAVLGAPLDRAVSLSSLPVPGHDFPKGLLHVLALGPGDRLLAAADDRGALHLVQMASGQEVNRIEFSEDQVRSAAWSPDGKRLLLGTERGALVELGTAP